MNALGPVEAWLLTVYFGHTQRQFILKPDVILIRERAWRSGEIRVTEERQEVGRYTFARPIDDTDIAGVTMSLSKGVKDGTGVVC